MVLDLAGLLRAETRTLHAQVEGSPFIARLLRGQTGRSAYGLLLRNLHPIYEALEGAAARLADATLRQLFDAELWRLRLLEADLDFLHGAHWRREMPVLPAAAAYARHLETLAAGPQHLLAAHAYVRYLGDLAGGQQLRVIVARSLGLPGDAGTAFYGFGAPADVRRLVQAFRSALNALGDAHAAALVAEAQLAFRLHGRLFDELERA